MRALSYSSITLYRDCPRRFKFRYVDEIKESPKAYFSFGRSLHTALEFLYGHQCHPPTFEELSAAYKTGWVDEGYGSPDEEKLRFNEGLRILRSYYVKNIPCWRPAFAVEYSFTVQLDGVEITGKIDRIDRLSSGGIHVTDYKTGRALDPKRTAQDEQLTLYQTACENSLDMPVQRLSLYHLPTLCSLDSNRHPETLVRKLRREIISTATAIEKKNFDPKPETAKCRRCDYCAICQN